jgi:ribosomal-protein-alanine N-acetyltransferase
MGRSIVISKAEHDPAEMAAVVAIDQACFAQGTLNVSAEIERPWSRIWVAREESEKAEPGAFLLAWLVVDELHILSVATLPAFRRRGMARALLERAIQFSREREVRTILLEVRRSNAAAIQLYRSFGFSAVSLRPRYYADNFEDAVEMSLVLDPSTGAILPTKDEVTI